MTPDNGDEEEQQDASAESIGGQDVTKEDILAIAQRALGKVSEQARRIDDLEEQLDKQASKITRLELRLSEFSEDREYEDLTMAEKVGMVREVAFRQAEQGTGRSKMDYRDIQWSVFDGGEPPYADHCYTLMQKAAGYDEETGECSFPGFRFRNPDSGNKHLAVNAQEARRHAVAFSSENNAGQGEGEV